MWTGMTLFGLLPLYVAFHQYYSTYQNTYGWVVSLAYVGGKVPAFTLFAIFICLIGIIEIRTVEIMKKNVTARRISRQIKKMSITSKNSIVDDSDSDLASERGTSSTTQGITNSFQIGFQVARRWWQTYFIDSYLCLKVQWILICMGIFVINAIIVLIANAIYVFSVLQFRSLLLIRGITFSIIIFKIV
jgi:hypothetical protein